MELVGYTALLTGCWVVVMLYAYHYLVEDC